MPLFKTHRGLSFFFKSSKRIHISVFCISLVLFLLNIFAFRFVLAQNPISQTNQLKTTSQIFELLSIDEKLISSQAKTVTTNSTPVFKGTGKAMSFLFFHLVSRDFSYTHSVFTDKQGLWSFKSASNLPSGSYLLKVYEQTGEKLTSLYETEFSINESTPIPNTISPSFVQMHIDQEIDPFSLYQGSRLPFLLSSSFDISFLQVTLEDKFHETMTTYQHPYSKGNQLAFSFPFSLQSANYFLTVQTRMDQRVFASSYPITIIDTPFFTKLALQMTSPYMKVFSLLALTTLSLLLSCVLYVESKKLFTLYQRHLFKKRCKILKKS